jgi:hypothetical protein
MWSDQARGPMMGFLGVREDAKNPKNDSVESSKKTEEAKLRTG